MQSNARWTAAAVAACFAPQVVAQTAEPSLPAVTVREAPSLLERNQLPGTSESITAPQIADTVNLMNVEDALKYLPSLILRKRNFGDQQAVLATRTSGLGQSTRSLVYADGILLSTLIGNNNSNASPHWSLVSPEEIERIDVLTGRFRRRIPAIPWARSWR